MGKVFKGASSFWEKADRRACQEKWQTYDAFQQYGQGECPNCENLETSAKIWKRGTRFQEERYLSLDDVYTRVTGQESRLNLGVERVCPLETFTTKK